MFLSESQKFWSEVGSTKEFTDPFYFERFLPGLNTDSLIVEYGCGYGRVLNLLHSKGHTHSIGFDFAPKMIERGKTLFPFLDLRLLEKPLKLPLADQSVDGVILSTVMTCIPESTDLELLFKDMYRALKPGGKIYISDFLITENEKYMPLYQEYKSEFSSYGTFITREGATVRHFDSGWIRGLVSAFDLEWYEEVDFVTMNLNPVRTFHLTAKKPL
jgi:ubiquinone/menaquinone biosynthesis C-methylase UbiE